MAVRLQMKLGIVAEQDRLPDSPDTIVVVEPTVSGIARSKGQLYLLVTSRVASRGAAEATRIAAETIRNEYYYDESAGIRVCLEKAIASVNKRLHHQRDRLGLGPKDRDGPIGIGVAVVRGNELYVATVGPAEAYLIRQARLATLPDPNRERGLPARELTPHVWRGEVNVGDSLVLISPNVVARLGPDELKDAAVTLHPQSAIEHLHGRFVAAGGSGSDAAIALEATEVSATLGQRKPVPVRAPEPLAGARDRSPIPLADPVADGVVAVQAGARQARHVAGNRLTRAMVAVQELLPHRHPAYRRVTPLSARRENQRRGAVAILAFIVVACALGVAIFFVGGAGRRDAIVTVTAGQKALDAARADVRQVFAPGVDLVANDPNRAKGLLTDAWRELDAAQQAGIPRTTIDPVRAVVVGGLDRLYAVVPITDEILVALDPATTGPLDLRAAVHGPDGMPYVLDRTTQAVYRIDLKTKKPTLVIKAGTKAAGLVAAAPKLIAVGGADVVIVDAKNIVWRWRPADAKGRGTLVRIRVTGAASWGDDIVAIATFVTRRDSGLYNLYVVDPSARQILSYVPSADGRGFPGANNWLDAPKAVDGMTSVYVDGDIFVVDHGLVARYVSGSSEGWSTKAPGDELLRSAPHYSLLASAAERRSGLLYAYDDLNGRVIAFDKASGSFREQYLIAAAGGLRDVRGMYVIAAAGTAPAVLVWVTSHEVHQAALARAPDGLASPSPLPPASASPGASGSIAAASGS
jgi:hypothetical protein